MRRQLLPRGRGSQNSSSGAPGRSGGCAYGSEGEGGEPDPGAERNLPEWPWPSPALRPSSKASAAAAGARAVGGGLGAGRPGQPSRARSPSAAASAADPPPPQPASKFGGSEPDAPRLQAHSFAGFRAPRLAGTLGSDADGCGASGVVLCVHRQGR